MTFRMHSNEELRHFKAFSAARDRARKSANRSPQGAFDQNGRELKAQWKRQFGANAEMGTGESTAPELDLATVHAVLEAVGDMCDEATVSSVQSAVEKAFPGLVNSADPESPDTVLDDTSDADANKGALIGDRRFDPNTAIASWKDWEARLREDPDATRQIVN
jgi:hypothetical protein